MSKAVVYVPMEVAIDPFASQGAFKEPSAIICKAIELSSEISWGIVAGGVAVGPRFLWTLTVTPNLQLSMAGDELAEIDGHKPKVLLRDGENREAKSSSGGHTYKIKRTQDHYYCHCPAWRNQACFTCTGVPVNARTCKHLRDILGDAYETARLELKNPHGTAKPGSSKGKGKRKRDDDDDDEEEEDGGGSDFDNDDEEDEDEDEPPQKKRKPASKAKGSASKGKGKKKADSDEDEESDAPRKKRAAKPASKGKGKAAPKKRTLKKEESDDDGEDFSDAINAADSDDEEDDASDEETGKKRKVLFIPSYALSFTNHMVQKPASKGAKPPAKKARTKKAASSDEEDEAPKKKKAASKGKSNKLFVSDDEATEDSDDEPAPKKKATKAKPVSKAKGKKKAESEEDKRRKMRATKTRARTRKDEDVKPPKQSSSAAGPSSSSDPLAEINGIKPKVFLNDGDDREVKSMSSNSTYKIKRTWDHYYCMAQSGVLYSVSAGAPVNARTCKHLRDLLGDAYEAARLKWQNPNGPDLKPTSKAKAKPKSKPASKGKGKKKTGDDDTMTTTTTTIVATGSDWVVDLRETGWRAVGDFLVASCVWSLIQSSTFYDGKGMVSRLGNPFTPPQWFLDKLPTDVTLDGELFSGRGNFQDTVSIVKTQNSPHWKNITFQIFDVPSEKSVFEDRVAFLQKLFGPGGKYECPEVTLVEQEKATSRKHVLDKLKEVEALGGEGLMLRKAKSKYEGRRSSTLLKIKTFYDAEAEVTGYTDGKGKHAGLTGALKCKMESGKTFNVGTGLSDKQRKNPPKIGTIITYRFQELTRDGVPRFPSFIGEAIDKKKAKDAKIPAHRKGPSKDD
ncbi:Dna ligase [Mycena venus]|uniref:Dna ligase n=1 Tax=Mycena venus TaxID=2733690 RepID=A0A8H6YXU3_9AGAR|nr:Dna ligase [Mycena venus]